MPHNTAPLDVAVIGSGFAGLSAAATLAKAGLNVAVYEQHEQLGGRARDGAYCTAQRRDHPRA